MGSSCQVDRRRRTEADPGTPDPRAWGRTPVYSRSKCAVVRPRIGALVSKGHRIEPVSKLMLVRPEVVRVHVADRSGEGGDLAGGGGR